MRTRSILFLLILPFWFCLAGCRKGDAVEREYLEGRYVFVDYRTPLAGGGAEVILSGMFELVVSPDGEVRTFGAWETGGRAVGRNILLEPVSVTEEDGTDLHFEFGLVEGSRSVYMLKGRYTVSGVVPDAKSGRMVEYHAKGWFDARKSNGR